jgi:hypothetical protein
VSDDLWVQGRKFLAGDLVDAAIKSLGKKLCDIALSNGPALSFVKPDPSYRLRVMFVFEDGDKAAELPWELLYLPVETEVEGILLKERFLALKKGCSIVRYTASDMDRVPKDPQLEDEVCAILAPPGPSADSQYREMDSAVGGGMLTVRLRVPAALTGDQAKGYNIVHFFAHGSEPDLANHSWGSLRLQGEDADASTIAAEVGQANIVVFNACHSSGIVPELPLFGICATVRRAGVPAVVGMQSDINTIISHQFASAIYRQLSYGESLDYAVNRARRTMWSSRGRIRFHAFYPTLHQTQEVCAIGLIANSDTENSTTVSQIASVRGKEMSEIAFITIGQAAIYAGIGVVIKFAFGAPAQILALYVGAAFISLIAGGVLYAIFRSQRQMLRLVAPILKQEEHAIIVERRQQQEPSRTESSDALVNESQASQRAQLQEDNYRRNVRMVLSEVEQVDMGLLVRWPRILQKRAMFSGLRGKLWSK